MLLKDFLGVLCVLLQWKMSGGMHVYLPYTGL